MVHESPGRCRFDIAAPRHFLYPSLLLLLAEEPRHGYRLVDTLLRLGFGPVDRPSVNRALADLESDGLLHSWEASSTAGTARHVYGVTRDGLRTLSVWMDVVAEERAALDVVLKRYDTLAADGHGEPDGACSRRPRRRGRDRWPAHLHIDLLTEARGTGLGCALVERWLGDLRADGIAGCHLETWAENDGAIAFFEAMGFRREGDPAPMPGMRSPDGGRHHTQLMVQSLRSGPDNLHR